MNKIIVYFILCIVLASCKQYDKEKDTIFIPPNHTFSNVSFLPKKFDRKGAYFYLCKIWGFLKYHSNDVTKGKIDWDKSLFKSIRLMSQSSSFNKKEFNDLINNLIIDSGYDIQSKNDPHQSVFFDYLSDDFSWFSDTIFLSKQIRSRLENILILSRNNSKKTQFYVENTFLGNPSFKNENNYSIEKLISKEYRLLGLFRYWNIINFFYPYKYDLSKDWNNVLYQQIPVFLTCKTKEDYHFSIIKLVKEIDDSHAIYKSEIVQQPEYIANVRLRCVDSSWVVSGRFVNSELSKLKMGDVLLKINNKSTSYYSDSLAKIISASTNGALIRDISHYMVRSHENEESITVRRDYDTLHISEKYFSREDLGARYLTTRRSFARKNVGRLIRDSIGYVNLEQIFDNNIDMSFDSLLTVTKGMILDLRGHPNDTYPYVAKKFLPDGEYVFSKAIYPDTDYPGLFRVYQKINKLSGSKNSVYNGKVILLVDENTQSHAEYSAMAFRTIPKITIIGTQTAGANGNVSIIPLPGQIKTKISGIGIFYPDMSPTQRIGIIPDIHVRRTLKGLKEGKDEILLTAINYINEE